MLQLKLGTAVAPINLDCSICHWILPANETFTLIETDPIGEDEKGNLHVTEHETLCIPCGQAVKNAAQRLKVRIVYDIQAPPGTKLMPEDMRIRKA